MNTIMEYYGQISERYFIARILGEAPNEKIKYLWQPLAKKAIISRYENFDFFTYKEEGIICLCEALTGTVIFRQCDMPTRELRRGSTAKFLQHIPEELDKKGGVSEINILIVNFLCDHEQLHSPRYKAVKI